MAGIKDVARRAGVSISTVSNVINGTKYVSGELRLRINRAIEELSYEVDPVARSLKSKKTMNIGVVITNISRIFFPHVIKGIQEEADKRGYSLTFCNTDDSAEKERRFVQMLESSWVDGIILNSVVAVEEEEYFHKLANLGDKKKRIPVVSLERRLDRYGMDSVVVDNLQGGRLAARHLIDCGCRSIAYVMGPAGSCMSRDRQTGTEQELLEAGMRLKEKMVKQGDFSPLSGYQAVKELLASGEVPDGIFAANDQMAIGAVKAVRELGLRIPEEVKVIGFDNTFVASITEPSLTTVNVPKYKLGTAAVEMLFKRMETPGGEAVCKELPINLVVRRSTNLRGGSGWDLFGW